ncbi:MAG: DNA-binding response regulator, partial [Muribaculaceae bacterium]|nr:DNA-binding response regulator [Muribaculaceae bacterium]
LSAKNATEEKIEGIKAGADVYIGKPFSLQYLRAVIERISENSIKLKEYYNSSASIYEYSGGKLLDRESKEFIDKITEYVDANIDNPDLSVDSIAEHLFTSPRNLYRKMTKLELLPPNDFVKNRRVELAAKLLRTTTLTTQEIIFRCGFSSRSHFYKEFQKRFATTPKVYREQSQQEINLQ